jgi:hypothetical protein
LATLSWTAFFVMLAGRCLTVSPLVAESALQAGGEGALGGQVVLQAQDVVLQAQDAQG